MITTASVTTSATQIVAPNAFRRLLVIQNTSDTDVFIKMDSSATEVTTAIGIKLTAGGEPLIITCDRGEFINSIRAIHGGTGSKTVRIQED